MTDEPRQPEEPEAPDTPEGADEEQEATPATWAGRQRSQADAPDDAAAEHSLPEEVAASADEPDEEEPEDETEDEELEDDEEAEEADDAEDAEESPQETIEANTPALADSEAAKEKAMAGLKARTAEHEAKRKGTTQAPTAKPKAIPAPPPPVAVAVAQEDEDEGPARRPVWPRFLAASFLIVVSMATATAVSLLVYLADFAKGIGGLEELQPNLTAVEPGKPQTFLILGSDKRTSAPGDPGRSDTTILLRIAPDSAITMMSIPRDLRVNIPNVGIDKFNAAYSYGGPEKTLKTTQQLTQDKIPINHVVNVDFLGFADAVNAIDCVYVDVDRHYYIPPETGTAEIDVSAGYQRLCGLKALQYVRYRHTDNDLVRSARQQDFLREARQAVPPSKLLNDYDQLTDILKKYTTSDIDGPATLLNLGKLLFAARGAPVVEVHFPTTSLGDRSGYVTSNDDLIQQAVSKFLDPYGTEASTSASSGGGKPSGGKNQKKEKKSKPEEKPKTPTPETPDASTSVIDSTASGQQYAELLQNTQHQESGKPLLTFPIFYPTRLTPGSSITDESRAFIIDGPGDEVYYGYKFVVSTPGTFGAPAYYGFSGTNWKDPPILANPSETKEIAGRDYDLFYDGERLRLVAWHTDKGSYWVTNTLTQQLSASQMLALAENAREYTG